MNTIKVGQKLTAQQGTAKQIITQVRRVISGLMLMGCAAMIVIAPAKVQAQATSGKPITLIVPFATGGATDIVARILAQTLSPAINTPVVVENKLGGGGVVGRNTVARAVPDGQTLLTLDMSFVTGAGLTPDLPYDSKTSFAPICIVVSVPHVLVVNANVPAKNIQELIALAKAEPGKLNFGSGGIGTNTHLGSELFKSVTNTDIVHVPYKGAGAVLADLMAGQVQILVSTITTVLPYIRSGKLRPLMVLSDKRADVIPDVPTAKEAGLEGMNMDFWVGIAAPKGTPTALIDKLNKEINTAMSTTAAKTQLLEMGLTPETTTPAQASAMVNLEIDRWSALIKKQNIKPE